MPLRCDRCLETKPVDAYVPLLRSETEALRMMGKASGELNARLSIMPACCLPLQECPYHLVGVFTVQ